MATYLPQCWHVVDNTVFYWSGHLMCDHAARYAKSGFTAVIFRNGHTVIKIDASETYFDQVLICCLIIAANLTGKVFPTNCGCLPYKRDLISLEELYQAISAVCGDVT